MDWKLLVVVEFVSIGVDELRGATVHDLYFGCWWSITLSKKC
jgi:hypothetical protein